MKRLNQTGSHVIAVAVLVLALAVVGFAGYKVYQSRNTVSDTATTAKTAGDTSAPSAINNSADLDKTAKALDDSSSQLNSDLDNSAMNADIDAML